MGDFSLSGFFEALFKYGKDYGLNLWHFLGLAIMGVILWVGSKVAAGAGRAVQGAQGVYVKMISDLQKKADDDRKDQEARVESLRLQLQQTRGDLQETTEALDQSNAELLKIRQQLARANNELAQLRSP